MDISEFLASMQTTAGNRALARNTHVEAGIPDVDNDPTTQNAGEEPDSALPDDQSGGDDMMADADQSFSYERGGQVLGYRNKSRPSSKRWLRKFEDGGEVEEEDQDQDQDQYQNLPASENIEDRRGEDTLVEDPRRSMTERLNQSNRDSLLSAGPLKDREFGGDGRVARYEEGGEVDEDDVTGAVTAPAIPDDEESNLPPGEEAPEENNPRRPSAMSLGGSRTRGTSQGSETSDWKSAAMEGINKAIDWGYNQVHGVNRGASAGEEDPEHHGAVKSMLGGSGAVNPQQWAKVLDGVDPEGNLDEATKQLKGMGELFKFYGGEDKQKGAAAVWSALQHQRRQYDAYAAHATVADDKGNGPAAAKSAQSALNKVPDGLLTTIKYLAPGAAQAAEGEKSLGRGAEGLAAGATSVAGAIPEEKPELTLPQDARQARLLNQDRRGSDIVNSNNRVTVGALGPNGRYAVTVTDPESGKTLLDKDLTPEQLKHALADGFDRMLHRGTVSQLGRASETQDGHRHMAGARQQGGQQQGGQQRPWWEQGYWPGSVIPGTNKVVGQQGSGQGQAPAQPQQKYPWAQQNGLPPEVDTRGMNTMQIAALRQHYQQQQVKDIGANARNTESNQSRERIAQGNNQSRAQVSQGSNTSAERRAHISAGVDPDTRQRVGDPTGRAAQNIANDNRIIESRVKDQVSRMGKPPGEDQINQMREQARSQYYKEQGRPAPGNTQQPQQPQQSGSPAPPQVGAVVKGYRYMGGPPDKPTSWQKAQ